jgi:hypothetical protein
MSRRRRRDEDVAGAQDRNRRCRNNGDVGGAMDRNDDRRDNRPVVINADEVIIRADRVIVREENDRRDNNRCGRNRRRGDRRDPFWWVF